MNSVEVVTATIDRSSITEILRVGQHLLDKKSDQDVLEINFTKNAIDISIYDHSAMVSSSVSAKTSGKDGMVIMVNPSEMYERLRKIESSIIQFTVTNNEVVIHYEDEGQRGTFSISTLSVPETVHEGNDDMINISINHDFFIQNLRMVKTAMAVEDIRDQFRGISIIIKENQITLWASDGIKMALTKMQVATVENFAGILPRRFVDSICSISSDAEVTFYISKKKVKYKIGEITVTSPLINAAMLDHEHIFKKMESNYVEFVIDSVYFAKKLDKIMVVSRNEGSALLKLGQECSLSSIASNYSGKADIEFQPANQIAEALEVYINPANILSFIRNFKTQVTVRIYRASNNIIVFKDEYPVYLTKLMRNPNYT